MDAGYIKLHREIRRWKYYGDIYICRLWIHLLLDANHEDQVWRGRIIEAGKVLTSMRKLAEETGLSYQQVRRILATLEIAREITRESTQLNTVITIVKWRDYQFYDSESNTRNNTQNNTQKTEPTNKKEERRKKEGNKSKVQHDGHVPLKKQSFKKVFEQIVEMYHETCPMLTRVKIHTPARQQIVKARYIQFKDHPKGPRYVFEVVFDHVRCSDFLNGTGKWKKCTFDWIMKQSNFVKIIEGNYDNDRIERDHEK